MTNRARRVLPLLVALAASACAGGPRPATQAPAQELPELARQVEIRRTEHGVPHILAPTLRAAAFGLAYVQLEDHGAGIIRGVHAARGRLAEVEGRDRIDADARARLRHARAVETFDSLAADTREVYSGFAAGMNHFIRMYPDAVPEWVRPDFTAQDVLARDIGESSEATMNRFRQRLLRDSMDAMLLEPPPGGGWLESDAAANVGSNAWALGPGRTVSGRAILLRNPHLSWTAGYYEAHVRVPGKLDFYGDFRIGGPFTVIGGFNPQLGFATTNNATHNHEFYALRVDPSRPGNVLFDGGSVPLARTEVRVEYRDQDGAGSETREFWSSVIGPVVHSTDSLVYVLRQANDGGYRAGEQWLEMMKARNLEEWQRAMRIEARTTSNFTYADRAGNIFYVWVAGAPLLPHPPGGDTLAILARGWDDVWLRQVPFDSLPQLLNPVGGYLHNSNDSPHYANLNNILADTFLFQVEPPRLRLRSQHSLELLDNDRVFSLEDVVRAKHSMRMLLADRVKEDLVNAVRAAGGSGERADGSVAQALEMLARWDNTAAADSRGAVLFEVWWNRYRSLLDGAEPHAVAWSQEAPATTPRGLAEPERASEAFAWAVQETARRYGSWNVAWGDVHRVRRGGVDVPVGGCGGALGCFRVLNFETAEDGKRVVNGGDGWVIAVEFGNEPRAYSVLAYGQSPDTASRWHDDQAAMFAANRMKPVRWTEADIAAGTVLRYHPGQEGRDDR